MPAFCWDRQFLLISLAPNRLLALFPLILSLPPSLASFSFNNFVIFLSFLLYHLSIYLGLAGFGERLWRDGKSPSEDVPAINLLLCSVTMGPQHQHPYPAWKVISPLHAHRSPASHLSQTSNPIHTRPSYGPHWSPYHPAQILSRLIPHTVCALSQGWIATPLHSVLLHSADAIMTTCPAIVTSFCVGEKLKQTQTQILLCACVTQF